MRRIKSNMHQFDDWWTAKLWREEIEAKKRRPLAEDFFYKPCPPEPKPRETRSAHQQRKAEVQSLQSLIEQRTQLGDIDHGPLPRAPPRCGNSVTKALRMRLGMKEERLTRDKKGDL